MQSPRIERERARASAEFRSPLRLRRLRAADPRCRAGSGARNQRGEIARTWWSRRFVDALEHYYGSDASRLARGRSYARAGQVSSIELSPGVVSASVQGSRPEPYAVRITVKELDDAAWANVETAMAARAVFLARLLAGEMPDEIEEAFDAAKVRLFPARRGDLVTSCTCPDTANPCKHIAAVYYLLARVVRREPVPDLRVARQAARTARRRAAGAAPFWIEADAARRNAPLDGSRGAARARPPVDSRILGWRELGRGAHRGATDKPSRRAPP